MKKIVVPRTEFWDEKKEEFFFTDGATLKLEHSLISISKWESIWHVSFIDTQKTDEQMISYIKCMTLNDVSDDLVYYAISGKQMNEIAKYIDDPMTATTITETKKNAVMPGKKITSEEIYYWMIKFGIPSQYEKWHLNRLITLIRVCSAYETQGTKRTNREIAQSYRELNEARKAKWGTKG